MRQRDSATMQGRDNGTERRRSNAAERQRARATTRQRGIAARQRDSAAARQTALQVCRLTSQHASTAVRAQSPHCNRGQPADWLWRQARRIAHRANRPQGTANRAPPKTTASHFRRMRDGPTHFRTSSQIPHHALLHTPSRTSSPHAPARPARAARDDDRNREHLPSRTCTRPARSRCPFHRGNSRTARTHSHIAHAHSRMPPYRMGQTHSHMPPCRMDRTCPCQKMSQWGLTATIRALYVRKRQNGACFPFALNRNHNKWIKKAQVKALRSRPWRPRIGIPLLISRAMRPLSGVLRQGVPKSLHCMRARRAAQASVRRASCA